MAFPDREPVIAEICERISNGTTLRAICRTEGMPKWRTVYDWLQQDADFSARFARARELGFDAIAQEALDIADTPLEGTTETTKEWGTEVKKGDMLDHRKLQIETRLKLLAKWDPKRYGEKQQVEHSGSVGIVEALNAARARSGL